MGDERWGMGQVQEGTGEGYKGGQPSSSAEAMTEAPSDDQREAAA